MRVRTSTRYKEKYDLYNYLKIGSFLTPSFYAPILSEVSNMTDDGITENAEIILRERYLKRDREGNVIETSDQLFRRVADAVAKINENYDDERTFEDESEEFYEALKSLDFVPNSPTLMNAGLEMGQLSACFVLSPNDHMDSIFQQVKNAAKIFQSGGGVGYSFSRLRPKGDTVRSTGGVASGPVSFMRVFDEMCNTIKQGGKRRGAQMGMMSVQHPDIEEFITAKDNEDSLNNFNISVAVTEDFMEAVRYGEKYPLTNPHDNKVVKKLDAQDVYSKIITQAWKNGEPGIIFIDRINKENPFDVEKYPEHYIDATNPCFTADTRVYTYEGLKRIGDLAGREEIDLVIDKREHDTNPLTGYHVRKTGERPIYRLDTEEGYGVRLTDNHKIRTDKGWVKARDLVVGEKIHILNKKGGFGTEGNFDLGAVTGWLVVDGTIKSDRAVLSFFGSEKQELSQLFAEMVHRVVDGTEKVDRKYTISPIDVKGRDEVRVRSQRLLRIVKEMGLDKNKHQVPEGVFQGSEEMQRGFLKALFTADGSFQVALEKGGSVRLAQSDLQLLKQVQQLLLNFGIASRIYEKRRGMHDTILPDGKGGEKKYECRAQHELVICKNNLIGFRDELGFLTVKKQERLEGYLNKLSRGPYREYFKASFTGLEEAGFESVYDLTEPVTHSFVANGIVVHNCGEQPLEDFEACNLGHINLNHCVKDGEIDWDKLEKLVSTGVRFLDNVVDASDFPNVVGYDNEEDAITKHVQANRKIGLGVMGWHHMLIRLGIPYDSKKALKKAEEVMGFIQRKSKEESRKIAEKRGNFPNWDKSVYDKPMRNATTTTIAPTGTTSMIADTSGGIEPLFAVSYVKNVLDGKRLVMPDPVFEEIAKERGILNDELMQKIAERGNVSDIDEVPDDLKAVFVTAMEIKPEWHIRMQGAFQKYVDNAISKTVNFPNDATEEDIKRVYDLAYDLKCKGVTVYRTGSRSEQVMEVEGDKKASWEIVEMRPRKRPAVVRGTTQKIPTGYGGLYVTINEDEHGLFEVFAQIGRSGGFTQSFTESLARLISLCLRSGIPTEEIISQLEGIRSPEVTFLHGEKILSIPDAMAKALRWHIGGKPRAEQARLPTENSDTENDIKKIVAQGLNPACPDCGSMMYLSEGCCKCPHCGYSQC